MSIADLTREMASLAKLPPIERAAKAAQLAVEARTTLTEVRLAAIHEATRQGGYREVAEALGRLQGVPITEKAVDRAVQEHRRRSGKR
jgi:ABC-type oligopeptide transport system substrate-binding subunit